MMNLTMRHSSLKDLVHSKMSDLTAYQMRLEVHRNKTPLKNRDQEQILLFRMNHKLLQASILWQDIGDQVKIFRHWPVSDLESISQFSRLNIKVIFWA